MGEIVVFSRDQCGHCKEAKDLLRKLQVPFVEIEIDGDLRNSMLMSRVSGRHTVPQIFFNHNHIGGVHELKELGEDAIREQAAVALREPLRPGFLQHPCSEEELKDAVIPIKDIIDPHLPAEPTAIPEYAAVRTWYSSMFGFLCNLYDQMALKPEPMALWIAVLSSAIVVVEKRIGAHFGTACFATALKAGCSYCSAHGADLSMKYAGEAPEHFQALVAYLTRDQGELNDLPFTPELKVVINLAAKMTNREIEAADMAHARSVYGVAGLREACFSVGGMGIIMGFLNRFNDLVGVEIEASIKHAIDSSVIGAGWEWGTHDTEDDENRYDCSTEQPDSPPADLAILMQDVKKRVFADVSNILPKYDAYPDEQLPAWIAVLPDRDTIRSLSALYHSLFNAGDLETELKHLSAYSLAMGSGHNSIAAEERRIFLTITSGPAAEAKLASAGSYAISGDVIDLKKLSTQEQLALRLAKCSDHFPHIVRGELVKEMDDYFSAAQIVELIMALAVIGMGQRWLAVYEPFSNYVLGCS